MRVEVKGEVEENQRQTLIMNGMEMTVDRLKDLSQCGLTRYQQRELTLNGVQMCSLIHVAHVVLCVLVLVGVGRVTVVHIGHEEVLAVIQFYVAIFS